jgi:nucleoside-diphosphate kinase
MIKPDAVENGHIGSILEKINSSGFKIIAMKFTKLSLEKAENFYEVHSDRPFFNELVTFMSRGPIVAAILEKNNAVEDFRLLIGSTNPSDAKEGTIRNLFATSMGENAVHGSDSDENAMIEGAFHFSNEEILS